MKLADMKPAEMKTTQVTISKEAFDTYEEFAMFQKLDLQAFITSRFLCQMSCLTDDLFRTVNRWRKFPTPKEAVTVTIRVNEDIADCIVCLARTINMPTREFISYAIEDDHNMFLDYLTEFQEKHSKSAREFLEDAIKDVSVSEETMSRGATPFTYRNLTCWEDFSIEQYQADYKGAHKEVFA